MSFLENNRQSAGKQNKPLGRVDLKGNYGEIFEYLILPRLLKGKGLSSDLFPDCELLSLLGASAISGEKNGVSVLLITPSDSVTALLKSFCEKNDIRKKIRRITFAEPHPYHGVVDRKTIGRSDSIVCGSAERIIDLFRREDLDPGEIIGVVVYGLTKSEERQKFITDTDFIFTRFKSDIQKLVFIPPFLDSKEPLNKLRHRTVLLKARHLEKVVNGKLRKEKEKMDMDKMEQALSIIIKNVQEREDPDELSNYKKVFKKGIPRPLRSWVIAFLLKEYISSKPGTQRKSPSDRRPSVKTELKEEAVLFVGIGRSKRINHKNIIHIFIKEGGLLREEIGNIKILENYSFVSVEKKKSESAIATLKDFQYRGRTLNVNFAQRKEDANN